MAVRYIFIYLKTLEALEIPTLLDNKTTVKNITVRYMKLLRIPNLEDKIQLFICNNYIEFFCKEQSFLIPEPPPYNEKNFEESIKKYHADVEIF